MKLFYLIFTIIFSTGKCFHNNFFFNQKINFVKDISHFLPNVDTIGHNVLLNNDKIKGIIVSIPDLKYIDGRYHMTVS